MEIVSGARGTPLLQHTLGGAASIGTVIAVQVTYVFFLSDMFGGCVSQNAHDIMSSG